MSTTKKSSVPFVKSFMPSVVKEPELNHKGRKGIHRGHKVTCLENRTELN
jgi:hypothetical protein